MFLGHWQFFKDFFQIAFLRYLLFWFAIVPIFVNLLSDLPPDFPIWGTHFVIHLSLPFTWWLLWLASLCYFIAFVLFQAFCPQFIKRYPSYTEYQTHGHSPRWVIWEFYFAVYGPRQPTTTVGRLWSEIFFYISPISQTEKLFKRVITKGYAQVTSETCTENPVVEKDQTAAYFEYNSKRYKIGCDPSADDVSVKEREIFWEVLGHFAKQAPALRSAISVLIAITVGLLLLVLLQHIWTVVRLVAPDFWAAAHQTTHG